MVCSKAPVVSEIYAENKDKYIYLCNMPVFTGFVFGGTWYMNCKNDKERIFCDGSFMMLMPVNGIY
jgi:hypothetical protein